jgi:Dullard-like phosphatase family protein
MESLKEIKKNYVVIVYTASHQSYADEVLNHLDPDNQIFSYRLYRHNCVRVKMGEDGIYVKDLRLFKNIDLKKIIIIDNSALSFAFHLENGIPILPFYKNKDDVEMKSLVNYLNQIAIFDDLREVNKKFLKLDYFLSKHIKVDEDDSMYFEESDIVSEEDNHNKDLFVLNPCEKSRDSITDPSFEDGKSRHISRTHKGSLDERLEDFALALKKIKK